MRGPNSRHRKNDEFESVIRPRPEFRFPDVLRDLLAARKMSAHVALSISVRHRAEAGTLIYFEPSAAGDAKLFREMRLPAVRCLPAQVPGNGLIALSRFVDRFETGISGPAQPGF